MRLVRYEIDQKLCRECGTCLRVCEHGAVRQVDGHRVVIDQGSCTACGACLEACKLRAIAKKKGLFR